MHAPSHCWPSVQFFPASFVGQMHVSLSPMPWMSQRPPQASQASLVVGRSVLFEGSGDVMAPGDPVPAGLEQHDAVRSPIGVKVKAKVRVTRGALLMGMW